MARAAAEVRSARTGEDARPHTSSRARPSGRALQVRQHFFRVPFRDHVLEDVLDLAVGGNDESGAVPDEAFRAFMERTFGPERVAAFVVLLASDDIEVSGDPDMLQSGFIHGIKRMPCRFTA